MTPFCKGWSQASNQENSAEGPEPARNVDAAGEMDGCME